MVDRDPDVKGLVARPAPGSTARSRRKLIIGLLVASMLVTTAFLVFATLAVVRTFDTDRDLTDFETPQQASTFTSAHLPAPLPQDAVVVELLYQRWTDWTFSARVRLPSAIAADQYLDQVRRARKLDDEYCYQQESAGDARYFLADVSACGYLQRVSPQEIRIRCNTR